MTKKELKAACAEALAEFLEPITATANTTRVVLGLPPIDVSAREDVVYQIDNFSKGFSEGAAGFYDKYYEGKIAFKAYQAGNFAGREFFKGEHFTIIPYAN